MKASGPHNEPSDSLSVLHVLAELRFSGAEMMLLNSARAFEAAGIDFKIVSTGVQVGVLAPDFRGIGIVPAHLPFRKTPKFLWELVSQARKSDVCHVHTERASFWICAALRIAGVPVVRTIHSSFLFEGHLRHVRSLQRRTLAWLGVTFLSIGEEVAANERDRFGIGTTVVRNWASSQYAPAEREYRATVKKVVTIGNCAPAKNHDSLIRAIAILKDSGVPLEYVHVGSEDQQHLNERELAEDLRCIDAISFVGTQDPLPILHAADLFVMPSIREGFGLAALEAILAGTPALLSDAPGLREFKIIPGVQWTSTDAHGLSEALLRMIDRPAADRISDARSAAAEATRIFSAKRSIGQLVEIYRKSCAHQRSGA